MQIPITHKNKTERHFEVPRDRLIELINLPANQQAVEKELRKQKGPQLKPDRTFTCEGCRYYTTSMQKLQKTIPNLEIRPGISAPGCQHETDNGYLKYPRAVADPTTDDPNEPTQSCLVYHTQIKHLVKSGQLREYQTP